MTDVVAILGRGALFTAPFRNSSSSACLPTSRSSAAIRASYCCSRSDVTASSSKSPASYFCTQTRIGCKRDAMTASGYAAIACERAMVHFHGSSSSILVFG